MEQNGNTLQKNGNTLLKEFKIHLMGRPWVETLLTDKNSHCSLSEDAEAMELLALWIISREYIANKEAREGEEVRREWLAVRMFPQIFVADKKRALNKVGDVLRKLQPHLRLRPSDLMGNGKRERNVVALNQEHLLVDLRLIEEADRLAQHDTILEWAHTPLLAEMNYTWLHEPEFRRIRAKFDGIYLSALLRKADGVLFAMKQALDRDNLQEAIEHREQALPLLDKARVHLAAYTEQEWRERDSPLAAPVREFARLRARADYTATKVSTTENRLRQSNTTTVAEATSLSLAPDTEIPNNLPKQLPDFIGRSIDRNAARELLGHRSLVTITGTGGGGKTRLAQQIAGELRHPDQGYTGIWFTDLASLDNPLQIAPAVAAAMGVKNKPDAEIVQTLIDFLGRRKVLLIVDNCEHLIEAVALFVDALLRSCSELRILATSREPLNIRGEQTYRLPPLSYPDEKRLRKGIDDSALLQYEAVQLFVARAREHDSSFELSGHQEAIARTCCALDGIPLALELAAARIEDFSPEEMVTMWEKDRFELLVSGRRTAQPHHQTMCDTLDWSVKRLSQAEQDLLARISIFVGGWTGKAAEAVCDVEDDQKVRSLLANLTRKSLLQTEDMPGGERRFRMYATIRQYCLKLPTSIAERRVLQERQLEYYVGLAEDLEKRLDGPEETEALDTLECEWENMQHALEWAETAGDLERGLRLASALWVFFYFRGYNREGSSLLERMLGSGFYVSLPVRIKALRAAGNLARQRRDFPLAETFYTECLQSAERLRDDGEVVSALGNLGALGMMQGNPDKAKTYYLRGLEIAHVLQDPALLGKIYGNLAILAKDAGDRDGAATYHQKCAVALRRAENWQRLATQLNNYAHDEVSWGNHEAALSALQESLALGLTKNIQHTLVQCLFLLFVLAAKQGKMEAAALFLGSSEAHRERRAIPRHVNAEAEYAEYTARVIQDLGLENFANAVARGHELGSAAIQILAEHAFDPT